MGNLRALMLDKGFESLSLADQTDVMRQAGAPDEMLSEWVSSRATGPTISANTGQRTVGFEDTSADAAAVLERNVEPNRARDVLPKLAEFAALGATAEVAPALAAGVKALKGLSIAQKAGAVGKAGYEVGKAGVGFWAADRALAMAGVPLEYRAMLLTAAGFTRPGEAARKAIKEVVTGARSATPVAREVATVAAPVADEAKAAAIAASRARREAAAAETVAKARAPVAAPVEPPPVEPPPVAAPTVAPAPAAPPVTQPSPEYQQMLQQELAARRARLAEFDQRVAAERAVLDPQFVADDAVSVVPPREVPMIPDDAVALVADPIPPRVRRQPIQGIVLQPPAPRSAPQAPPQAAPVRQAKGTTTMATNLGGKAKAGPPPTKPEDLEETLRASLTKIEGEKGHPLRVPRIETGAERVGRGAGMTKEEVRKVTGPVLDEAVGDASPILPKQALESIVTKMRSIPVAEREAYVARATSGKARWQIENIRRTLESLGLLVPVGGLSLAQLMDREK